MLFCLADSISPFVFVTVTRLIVANFVIAFIEMLILRLFFRVRRRSLYGWMFLANSFSTIVGGLLLFIIGGFLSAILSPLIFHLKTFLISMYVSALVVSFALELPFVIAAARPVAASLRRTILACGAAQLGSYILLVPFYWLIVQSDLRATAAVIPTKSLDFVTSKSATLLFLSPVGPSVMECRLDGTPARALYDLSVNQLTAMENPELRDLTVRKATNADRWDLLYTRWWNEGDSTWDKVKLLQRGITPQFPDHIGDGFENNYIDWRPPSERDWTVAADSEAFAPGHGLEARNTITGEQFRFGLNSLFISSVERCPNILPGDQLVFEVSGEIVVLDLNTRKLGFIAYGHGPIVISPR